MTLNHIENKDCAHSQKDKAENLQTKPQAFSNMVTGSFGR